MVLNKQIVQHSRLPLDRPDLQVKEINQADDFPKVNEYVKKYSGSIGQLLLLSIAKKQKSDEIELAIGAATFNYVEACDEDFAMTVEHVKQCK